MEDNVYKKLQNKNMDPSYRYQTIVIAESAEMFYVSLQLMQLLEGKYKQILFGSTRNFI